MTGLSRVSLAVCLIYLIAQTVVVGGAVADPSFSCAKASTADERTICDDGILSRIDSIIADAYRTYKPEFQSKKSVSRRALADRRACKDDKVCIAAAQLNALQAYGGDTSWVEEFVISQLKGKASQVAFQKGLFSSRMPELHGQCVWTRIKSITTRFGDRITLENENEGTSIVYANDGYVVTYGRDYEFFDAKIGDPVVICLISVMYDCPTGDDRGSYYYTLDTRTGGSWTLPDAQHMCGGA